MKVLIILLAISPFLKYSEEYEKILCSHSWRVEYIKTLRGTDDPLSTKHISEIVNTPPLCGQVLTFKKDKTCVVQNRGKGRWSEMDKFYWALDASGNMRLKNKGPQIQYSFSLKKLIFNNDSIIFYIQSRGIESEISFLTVYKLSRVKISDKLN